MGDETKTVLVVDDSESIRRMLQWVLQSMSLEFLEAGDGKAALDILAARKIDLAIVDLNMPGMDGIRLIKKIRTTPETRDLPVLMLTTEGRDQDKKLAYAAGANMYLVKPSPPEVVRYKVLALLGLESPASGPGA